MLSAAGRFVSKKSRKLENSKFHEEKAELICFVGPQEFSSKILNGGSIEIQDIDQLSGILHQFFKKSENPIPISDRKQWPGLANGIKTFESYIRSQVSLNLPEFNFFTDLLPQMINIALEYSYGDDASIQGACPLLPTLVNESAGSKTIEMQATLTRRQIRHILCNTFLMNTTFMNGTSYGQLSFKHLYASSFKIAAERLVCFLVYFFRSSRFTETELSEEVQFRREILRESTEPKWTELKKKKISRDVVDIHVGSMEQKPNSVFVDFANRQYHLGEIIASCTQEEILFNCAPEGLVGMVFIETMADNETVIVQNLKRFSTYSGFGDSFRFENMVAPGSTPASFDVLVIDASYEKHFRYNTIIRDLNKAYIGFSSIDAKNARFSTGNWGCGVFGGDRHMKFIQQICAATQAGVSLDYSTYGDEVLCKAFESIIDSIVEKKLAVSVLVDWMVKFHAEMDELKVSNFGEYIRMKLNNA